MNSSWNAVLIVLKKLSVFVAFCVFATLHGTAGYCGDRSLGDRFARVVDPAWLFDPDDLHDPIPAPQSHPTRIDVGDVAVVGCRLPGEFERQGALLLACRELIDTLPELFLDIVWNTRGKIEIIALVSDANECAKATALLRASSTPDEHVHFVELSHDTMWARDYGPMILSSKTGRPVAIDAVYDVGRANDDRVPEALARLFDLRVVRMPARIDGGNLLSNGEGLAITTSRLFIDEDASEVIDTESMCEAMRRIYGLERVVILEPLDGEPTGHVDMFATFPSANTVVVARCDPEFDPENAAILDRNAAKLSKLQTAKGPLRVIRIPMPPHDDGIWRTYTNVVYANGVLLVPIYARLDQVERTKAIDTFVRLLPQWKVVGINANHIIESDGALHCITMNLGPIDHLRELLHHATRTTGVFDLVTANRLIVEDAGGEAENVDAGLVFRGTPYDGDGFRRPMTVIRYSVGPKRTTDRPPVSPPQWWEFPIDDE